jgi:MFS transporter, FLVCR family, feline leukemia virus subgroup C receptor-related protein
MSSNINNLLLLSSRLVFKSSPPTPPSAAQEATKTTNPLESSPFLHSIKRLLLNKNYLLLLLSYGLNVGVFYAISTLLNQVSVT